MAELIAVNISEGGIPKLPVPQGTVTADGLVGDGQAHAKHRKPNRALCTLDIEIIEQLQAEGYAVAPGVLGENLTLRGCNTWLLVQGARLRFNGGVEIELTEARKPCFILDAVHPDLKQVTVGRIGWMASVVRGGRISPGESIDLVQPAQMRELDRDEQ